jgi:acetylornithine deacetylase
MEQGHKPDGFITVEQLHQCDAMRARLAQHPSEGANQ